MTIVHSLGRHTHSLSTKEASARFFLTVYVVRNEVSDRFDSYRGRVSACNREFFTQCEEEEINAVINAANRVITAKSAYGSSHGGDPGNWRGIRRSNSCHMT